MEGPGFFEGTEKVLEIWFENDSKDRITLRDIEEKDLEIVLKHANCYILSSVSGDRADSYVLSESSLFVYDYSLRIKTCGTTTLLLVLEPLLALVREKCNLGQMKGMWYSKMSLRRPDLQKGIHQSFTDEVGFLDNMLKERDVSGAAYVFGRLNGDHWNLYSFDAAVREYPELTFEVLMRDLDPDIMKKHFYVSEDVREEDLRAMGRKCTKDSGLWEIVGSSTLVDETMFQPCGYSLNALQGDFHTTIHVTPQPECSYASFETTVPYKEYKTLLGRLVKCFKPSRFIVNIVTCDRHRPSMDAFTSVDGFKRNDWVTYNFENYELAMGHFLRVKKNTE